MSKLVICQRGAKEECQLSLKIENFVQIRNSAEGRESQRHNFDMGALIGLPTEYCIYLRQHRHGQCGEIWSQVVIELTKKPKDVEEVNLTFWADIKNFKQTDCTTCQNDIDVHPYNMTKYPEGMCLDILSEDVMFQDLPYTDDGAIYVEIHLELHAPKRNADVSIIMKEFIADRFIPKLQSDMSRMLQGNGCCPQANFNSKIVCKDGVEVQVNRGIMSARSPVFMRMFQADMVEAKTGVVQVKDISSPTMKVLFHFMYAGILLDEWSSAGVVEELVYAAGKYDLEDLVEFLDKVVELICTKENAGTLINLARKLNMKSAERSLLIFIKNSATCFEDFEKFVEDSKKFDAVDRLVVDKTV